MVQPKYKIGDRVFCANVSCVHSYFNDMNKTSLWFRTKNPMLGNIRPVDMIKVGRIKKLKKFINDSIDGIFA